MNGGVLRGNLTGITNYGELNIYGGEIHNNADSGVIVGGVNYYATLSMHNGRIHHNKSAVGSGVRIVNGTFTMFDGR